MTRPAARVPRLLGALALVPVLLTGCSGGGSTAAPAARPSALTPSTPAPVSTLPSTDAEAVWKGQATLWVDGHLAELRAITRSAGSLAGAAKRGELPAAQAAVADSIVQVAKTAATLPHNAFGSDMNDVLVSYTVALGTVRRGLLTKDSAVFGSGATELGQAVDRLQRLLTRAGIGA